MTSRLRSTLFRAYWFCERRLVPNVQPHQASYEEALQRLVTPGIEWLDVGCGHQVLPQWRAGSERELVARSGRLVGLDPELAALQAHTSIRLRIEGSASHLPLRPASFDLVTANLVVEHLDDPVQQFAEVHRVLRPGGRFVFYTPNNRSHIVRMGNILPDGLRRRLVGLLHGRAEEDVFPTRYLANNPAQIRAIAGATGFEVEVVRFNVEGSAFVIVLPLAILELLWIRQLQRPRLAQYAQTLLVILRKPPASRPSAGDAVESRG